MSKLPRARRVTTLSAIGFYLGFLACVGNAQADKAEDFSYKISNFQFATAVPFEASQAESDYRLSEPFGLATSALVKGGIEKKWGFVQRRLLGERRILTRCRTGDEACPPAAKRFLAVLDRALTHKGWSRIAEINRAINLDIKPVDDMTQYGIVDLWATPLMVFASNAGDCEDYAIAKYAALHEIGISDADLRLVVVRDHATEQDHAVAAVRYDGRWLILDNRMLEMRQDASITDLTPLFVIDSEGVRRMVPRPTNPQNLEPNTAVVASTQSSFRGPDAPLLL
jgi:predicted transglutaminase-like cysteine proteinase